MMTRSITFVLPGSLERRTGGTIYDRHIVKGLRALGSRVDVIELAGNYPFPTETERALASEAFAAIPDGRPVIVDGLAYGALPELAQRERQRLRLIALVHHPLSDETGLPHEEREELEISEKQALEHARRVIVTSPFTQRRLSRYGVMADDIRVVVPGVEPAPLAERNLERDLVLLCPAALIPRKGHRELLRALSELKNLRWRLVCAGKKDLDQECASDLHGLANELGLEGRIEFCGEVGEHDMGRLYADADLMVLASHYEGYGMVVTEAIARGLPVVTTTGGALAETLPEGAGLASDPGDVRGLRDNLKRILSERMLYERLSLGARAARNTLPTWEQAAAAFDAALRDL
jgi:glycosyltransferase involved in cell wall biosynthesis